MTMPNGLRTTRGRIAGRRIRGPTVRAVVPDSSGESALLRFTYHGDSAAQRALANGQVRRQLGLKLRAQNSRNVIYVMWRLDGEPRLEVSVKSNPGMRTHGECGARGYITIAPAHRAALPALADGSVHALHAEILDGTAPPFGGAAGRAQVPAVDVELVVRVDGRVVWRGTLPEIARGMAGHAGLRSDNVQLDIEEFAAPARNKPEER